LASQLATFANICAMAVRAVGCYRAAAVLKQTTLLASTTWLARGLAAQATADATIAHQNPL
jgi:hypothetical protein